MITQEEAVEYIKKNEAICPNCRSENIIGERFDVAENSVYQEISCENCGFVYYDIYELVGVGIIEPEAITEYYSNGRIEHG